MGLDRTDVNAEERRDLCQRAVLVVAQRENLTLHVGEEADLLGDLPADLAVKGARFRAWRGVHGRVERARRPGVARNGFPAAGQHDEALPLQPVPALVDGGPGEPRAERALVPVTEESIGEPRDGSLVELDEPPERLPVPGTGRADELRRLAPSVGQRGRSVSHRHGPHHTLPWTIGEAVRLTSPADVSRLVRPLTPHPDEGHAFDHLVATSDHPTATWRASPSG